MDGGGSGVVTPCANCGRPYDPVRFPLARPRKDGTRRPFRYCDTCLAVRTGAWRQQHRKDRHTLCAAKGCGVRTPRRLCYYHARVTA